MEQRRLRLGDIVDDYCPRERRVTNHAVVAMVEEDVKQTRCTTCDTEHPYKGGKAPRRRKKDTTDALYKEVLAGLTDADAPPAAPALAAPIQPVARAGGAARRVARGERRERQRPRIPADAQRAGNRGARAASRLHRQRCRSKTVRCIGRSFVRRCRGSKGTRKNARRRTSRFARPAGRGGQQFQNARGGDQNRGRPRHGQGQGQAQPSNRPHGAGARFAGSRPGQQTRGASSGRPQGGGFRGGPPQGRTNGNGNANGNTAHGGGRKRSR